MNRLAFVLAIVLGATYGQAQALGAKKTTLPEISAQVFHGDMLCSEFIQEKRLQALSRPLFSSGKLIFVAEKGILWLVQNPYPAQFLIKDDELIRWDEAGHAHKSRFGSSPIFRALSSIFLDIFNGDFEGLYDTFDLSATQSQGTWHLALAPKDATLAAVVSEVRATGGHHVEEVSILEARGDQTLIRLRSPQFDSCELEDHEKAYFAQ